MPSASRERIALLVLASLLVPAAASAQTSEPAPPASQQSIQVEPPRLLGVPEIPYPEGAVGDAVVVLVLVVGADGAVSSATPTEVNPPFSEAAVSAAQSFRFEPALRGGVAVAAKIRFEISFREPPPAEAESPLEVDGAAPVRSPRRAAPPRAGAAPVEILVEGQRPEPSRSVSLTRAEVRQIPGTFGDPFRALEIMPGVTPIVSGLPFFFVRGAPPGNVGYFLDGVRVPLLFHVGAGPSVVHPGLVDRVDLYPGGYPARFGRFSGGIVAGETAPPDMELSGEYNLRLFDAGGLVEAPFDEGRGSLTLGGRYSYSALLLSLVSPETTLEYWDYQTRLSYRVTPEDEISIFAFGSYDYVAEDGATESLTLFGTEFHRVDLRHDRRLGERGTLRTAFGIGIDHSTVQQDRQVRNRLAAARTELDYSLSRAVRIRAGTDLALDHYDVELGTPDLGPSGERIAENFTSRTDLALGIRADMAIDVGSRFQIIPGVRGDAFASEGALAWAIDPRLSTRLLLAPSLQLLVALGIAHQPPAFVVPVPGFQPGGLRGGLQRSIQESVGLVLAIDPSTEATVTAFQSAFFNMSDPLGTTEPRARGCPPGAFPRDSLAGDPGRQPDEASFCGERFDPGRLGGDRTGGSGQASEGRNSRRIADAFEVRTLGSAYGLELSLKRRLTSKLGGFFSYTLSRSTRSYERRQYVATFDRTHVANAAVAYDLGRGHRIGGRVMFYTGLPQAPEASSNGSSRLPPFFRLDLRYEKRWQLGERTWLSLVAEWMNATLSREAVTTRCTLEGCEAERIGPITIPSLGIEGGF